MKTPFVAAALAALLLAGCSNIPDPPMPSGERIAVNGQPVQKKTEEKGPVWNFAEDGYKDAKANDTLGAH